MLATIKTLTDYHYSSNQDLKSFNGLTGKRLKPVRAGEAGPNFILIPERGIWQEELLRILPGNSFSLNELLVKPLVIAFFSSHWRNHGKEFLNSLRSIKEDIQNLDSNLLILSAEDNREVEDFANKFSINIYHDRNLRIAEKFGIFSEDEPIWNRFSGIDVNVPLLSVFAISPRGNVLFDYVKQDFSESFAPEDLIVALHTFKYPN